MRKRLVALMVCIMCMVSFSSCSLVATSLLLYFGFSMGRTQETNPTTYAEALQEIETPAFLPNSIDAYIVNAYSYTRYDYMDSCVELFMELTVNETDMQVLLDSVHSVGGILAERAAYYADGYTEIVFTDSYTVHEENKENVHGADIQKVIFNTGTGSIIYEYFKTYDTAVYEVKDVAYFQRFDIAQEEYVKYTIETNQEEV